MRPKWRAPLALTFALLAAASTSPSASGNNSKGGSGDSTEAQRPAVYVARVVSVSAAGRDAFVSCLRQKELPGWRRLKRVGLLADQSVFETTSLRISAPGVPPWNFLLLTRLAPAAAPDAFFKAEEKLRGKKRPRCEEAPGREVRRVEVLHSTPNSYYSRPDHGNRLPGAPTEFSVNYIVEYIAVRQTSEALDEYRETMRRNNGPAIGQLIREGWLLNFIALETVSVRQTQPGVPNWNQIHVRGYFPEKGTVPPSDLDGALRSVNPQGGGTAGIFGRLDAIRTKPREDVARQLPELAVR
ncbi:MAG: hypothetical protein LC776_11730 [Acidobacteria bacterium]|nr:hypothetical protein [Acidobacteriota bacterium]